ncbi:MAG: hypothetical protein IJ934_07370, partial [Acetobacter sp.]|nr:hypothetical protein [Acetobacter sp.]
ISAFHFYTNTNRTRPSGRFVASSILGHLVVATFSSKKPRPQQNSIKNINIKKAYKKLAV